MMHPGRTMDTNRAPGPGGGEKYRPPGARAAQSHSSGGGEEKYRPPGARAAQGHIFSGGGRGERRPPGALGGDWHSSGGGGGKYRPPGARGGGDYGAPTTTRTRIASTGKRGEHLLPKARSIRRRRLEKQTGRTDNIKDMVQPLPSLSAILLLNLEACTYSLVRDVKDAALFLRLNVGHLFVCICRDGFSRRRDEEMDWRHSHRGEGIANPTESPTADMPPGSYAFLILCRASIFTCGSIGLTRRLLVSANSLP